ncbi:MAG: 50S ribosomal protein L23 [Candidatus Margulisbacteria bacterium GWF2_35_9]|nr:MAG: 50S ribosomal protein L23 [Candidatus Margulisbacteria bacterium GWF2_35_9]
MDKQIIIKPIITEKSSILGADNRYVFKVIKSANKIEIRKAVESLFSVKVKDVNTLNVRSKKKRMGKHMGQTSEWKKAMVTLQEGNKLENFEKLV